MPHFNSAQRRGSMPSKSILVYVFVQSANDPECIAGLYQIEVDSQRTMADLADLGESEFVKITSPIADAASRCFHEHIGIDNLDEYAIAYLLPNGDEISYGTTQEGIAPIGAHFHGCLDMQTAFPYLVCEAWSHLFPTGLVSDEDKPQGTERLTRWIIDLRNRSFVPKTAEVQLDGRWRAMNQEAMADLMESLNDNDIFTAPFQHGVTLCPDTQWFPEWVPHATVESHLDARDRPRHF